MYQETFDFYDSTSIKIYNLDKKIRYDRLSRRTVRPFGKSDAIKRDISEIENIAKAGPIAYADYYIFNNGTINDFHNRLDEILNNIKE